MAQLIDVEYDSKSRLASVTVDDDGDVAECVRVIRCSACKEADRSVFLPEGCLFCNVWDSVTRSDGFCYCGGVSDDNHDQCD